MSASRGNLIIFGSGPGIGSTVGQHFATRGFRNVILLARRADQLEKDANLIRETGAKVITIKADLSHLKILREEVLPQIEQMGTAEMILFNGALVRESHFFDFSTEELEVDLKITCLALYEVAKWAIPLFKKGHYKSPSLLVTNSMLYKTPISSIFSLCLTKSAQRSMVLSLDQEFGKEVHIGLLSVEGAVSPEREHMSPATIAAKAWEWFTQEQWTNEIEIPEI